MTPGRILPSISSQRADEDVARRRHLVDLARGLLDDHDAPPVRSLRVRFEAQRRDRRADVVVDLGRAARAVDAAQQAALLVVAAPAAAVCVVVDLEALADGLGLVVVALDQPRAVLVADALVLGRVELDVVDAARSSTLTRRPETRRTSSSSGTSMSSAAVMRRPSSSSARPEPRPARRCAGSRRGGSRRARRPRSMRSRIMSMMSVVGHELAGVHEPLGLLAELGAVLDRGAQDVAGRDVGRRKSSCRRSACVPLPAPGGPRRMRLSSARRAEVLEVAWSRRAIAPESVDAAATTSGSPRSCASSAAPRAASSCRGRRRRRSGARCRRSRSSRRLVDQDRRQGRDGREVQRAGERQAGEDAVEELGRRPAGPHARDEAAVLLQVVRLVDRVERDRRVEVGEEDDQDRLADQVGRSRRD